MTLKHLRILSIICVFLCVSGVSAQVVKKAKTDREKAELIRLTKEISRASVENDAATLERLMDENFILYGVSNKIYDKSALIKFWTKKDANVAETSTPDDFDVRIYTDTAIVISTITDTERENGKESVVKTKAFDVWKKTKKGWRWIASRETLLP